MTDWHPTPRDLTRQSLFATLTNEECERMLKLVLAVECSEGDTILQQDDTSQNLWIVVQGKFTVVRRPRPGRADGPVVLANIEAGDTFGEMSFYHPAPHSASVIAATPGRLLRLARADYDLLVEEGDRAAYKLARNTILSLADRLRRMDDWVVELLHDSEHTPDVNQLRDALSGDWVL